VARKPSDTVQLKLRFPEALRRRLEREAKRHGRSLNSEILAILEDAFRKSDDVHQRAMAIAAALGDEIVEAIVEQAKKVEAEELLADSQREDEQIERGEREKDK
jgi:plasmid stability protein